MDYANTFIDLFCCYKQWRCKTDLVSMGWFCQQSVFFQQQAQLPGSIHIRMFYHYRIQQAFSTDRSNMRRMEVRQLLTEIFTGNLCVSRHVFVAQHCKRFHSYSTGQRVSAVSASVFSGPYAKHDWVICKYGTYRQCAAT